MDWLIAILVNGVIVLALYLLSRYGSGGDNSWMGDGE